MEKVQPIDICMYVGLSREVVVDTDDYEIESDLDYECTREGYVPYTTYGIDFSNTDLKKAIQDSPEIYTLPKLLHLAEDMARMLSDISEEPKYKQFYSNIAEQYAAWEVIEEDYTRA